jgi:Domain of unknown function (DUF4824)
MTGHRWIAPLLLIAGVNVFVLVRVAANRRGAQESSLSLTEREMPVAFVSPSSESSGVALRIKVEHWVPMAAGSYTPDPTLDPLGWLDARKLAEVGFQVNVPSSLEDAELYVRRQLPRVAYAVLEHGGRAWKAYKTRIGARFGLADPDVATMTPLTVAEGSDKRMADRELRFGSRLFVVDVGTDPAALRARYPERNVYQVVPAKVHVHLERHAPGTKCTTETCRMRGTVTLLIDEVSVPRRLQRFLPRREGVRFGSDETTAAPRYEVVVRSGRGYEPWIEDIRNFVPLAEPGSRGATQVE